MSKLPLVCLIDRDGVLNVSSSNPESPLYYVTELDHIIIKPGAREALAIIRAHRVLTYLVTKQRCISKGLASRERVDLINNRVQRLLGHDFDGVYVEPEAETKRALYEQILKETFVRHVGAASAHLFDDSEAERTEATRLGFTVHDGTDLYGAVCRVFGAR